MQETAYYIANTDQWCVGAKVTGVVHKLLCKDWPQVYVGETKRTLKAIRRST